MGKTTIHAHFDGKHIVLDEPFVLPVNAPLAVTILPTVSDTENEDEWLRGVATSEAFDFLKNPAEDIYSLADGEPLNDAE